MLLTESLIIAYSTPSYGLTNHFLESLKDSGVNDSNINLFIDNEMIENGLVEAHSEFWIQTKIRKLKNLIKVLTENEYNNTYKYFISSDCDIWFLKEHIKEWDNLQKCIDESVKDIFFMTENGELDGNGGFNINTGFFIIKNNLYLHKIIIFLNDIYNSLIEKELKDINCGDQYYINMFKYTINFGYIPNDCVIWATRIWVKNKSIIHHPVCCPNVLVKKQQIGSIKRSFGIYNKSCNIIIAKYKENIEWVNYLDNSKIFIYDKSENPIINSIPRPNIGRDPETFLYHIIQNYDKLPDYLIFMQGEPFPHFRDLSVNKENLQEKIYNLMDIDVDAACLFCPIYVHQQHEYPGLNVKEYYNLLFQKPCPLNLQFASGCQYIVSKKNILERPKKFYEFVHKIIYNLDINNYDIAHYGNNVFNPNSMSVWCLERLLLYIFNSKYVYNYNYNCSDPIF